MRVSSRVLANWYPRLAVGLEAGLSLQRGILTNAGPSENQRATFAQRLAAGDDIPTALDRGGQWLPEVDRQLIGAGAAAGRLPEVMRRLAARHQEISKARAATLLATLYPLAIAHLGALAFPIAKLVNGAGSAAYLAAVFKVLAPFWIVVLLATAAVRLRLRPALVLLDVLPFVGGYRRNRALADLAYVLEAQLTAGIRLDVAWLRAAQATEDRRLDAVAIAVATSIQQGHAVGPVLAGRRELPHLFADFYVAGETTGTLDENLRHIQRYFGDVAATRLKTAMLVYPALLFVVVAAWVIVQVVLFYTGLFNQYDEILQ